MKNSNTTYEEHNPGIRYVDELLRDQEVNQYFSLLKERKLCERIGVNGQAMLYPVNNKIKKWHQTEYMVMVSRLYNNTQKKPRVKELASMSSQSNLFESTKDLTKSYSNFKKKIPKEEKLADSPEKSHKCLKIYSQHNLRRSAYYKRWDYAHKLERSIDAYKRIPLRESKNKGKVEDLQEFAYGQMYQDSRNDELLRKFVKSPRYNMQSNNSVHSACIPDYYQFDQKANENVDNAQSERTISRTENFRIRKN